jgi:hypothetical protein
VGGLLDDGLALLRRRSIAVVSEAAVAAFAAFAAFGALGLGLDLAVGGVSERVTITADVPVLRTETASLGTVVEHVDLGPVALALLKRGVPAETELATGPEGSVAAAVDADSLPPAEQVGAGRRAVERLRSGSE